MFGVIPKSNATLSGQNREKLRRTIESDPRRSRPSLDDIQKDTVGWKISFKFSETLVGSFCAVTGIVPSRVFLSPKRTPVVELKTKAEHQAAVRWIELLGPHVAIRDCLDASFALDFNKVDGYSKNLYTRAGVLVRRGKVYHGIASQPNFDAAAELARRCCDFIGALDAYRTVDAVMAVLGSRRFRFFKLQREIARLVAEELKLVDLSTATKLTRHRKPAKQVAMPDKIDNIDASMRVDSTTIQNKKILLIDDLYQSGVTMNYQGLVLKQLGAAKVFGLACVKTCGDRDNAL